MGDTKTLMDISQVSKENCSGCSACVSICPQKALSLKADEQGFLYPFIEEEKCINCGFCMKVHNGIECIAHREDIVCYAAKNRNVDTLKKSSSGGISAAIAKQFIDDGGVVFGVIYDENYNVVTRRLNSLEELESLYGSKYVQTDLKDTLVECYKDLCNGLKVAFFGTSCHISGLLSFLSAKKCDTSKLLTIDLICHGVPSPLLFRDYVNWLKENPYFYRYDFRTKYKPWGYGSRNFGCAITYKKKNRYRVVIDSVKSRVPLNVFFSNNCLRPHCYNCPYIGIDKPADITIADFWGCNQEEPDFFSESGVSAVIVHSDKARLVLSENPSIEIKETTSDKICKKQGNLHFASKKAASYDLFWKQYKSKGFKAVARKYGGYNLMGLIRCSFIHKLYERIKYGAQ